MPCGQLTLQDPNGHFWLLSATNSGTLTTQPDPFIPLVFTPPILKSPSFNWILSATVSGIVLATQTGTTGLPTATVASPNGTAYALGVTDSGIITSAGTGIPFFFGPAQQRDVSMSVFADRGLTSTLSGATPLIVGADMSIWSCSLQQYIPVDSTNMIVVYEE